MFVLTNSGIEFDPQRPDASKVKLHDIAHALSNQCRWSGHVRWFYSVAEHSVRASHLVPQRHALAVLLHDASEAYVQDMPTPIKHSPQMRWYRDLERGVQAAIGMHFGIQWKEHEEAIKFADRVMLASEARDLMGNWLALPDDVSYLDERIIPMSQQMARQEFLRRYFELRPGTDV